MSYFPPPPAPPPAQAFPQSTYAAKSGAFQSRGRGGQRDRGGEPHSRGPYQERTRGGYSRGLIRTSGHSDDRKGVSRYSYDKYGQTLQNTQAYLPPLNYGQNQANNPLQASSWNTRPASTTEQLTVQAPPIRIGHDPWRGGIHSQIYQPRQSAQYGNDFGSNLSQPSHHFQSALRMSGGRGQKRGHKEAFERRGRRAGFRNHQTAPAAPNFGGSLPLPPKPPAILSEKKRWREDKKGKNKLGLTPKAEGPDSNGESEDDEDEETKLAANSVKESSESLRLQISYKGQTSTLQSAADIAAWIEERKRRYPTKERVAEAAEKNRQTREKMSAARQAEKESRQIAIAEAREKRMQKVEREKKRNGALKDRSAKSNHVNDKDAAAKAKLKVEELRRRLEKEERRIARAEAKILATEDIKTARDDPQNPVSDQSTKMNKRKRSHSPQSKENQPLELPLNDTITTVSVDSLRVCDEKPSPNTVPDLLTPTSRPPEPIETLGLSSDPNLVLAALKETSQDPVNANKAHANISSAPSSSPLSSTISSTDTEDLTSSSGSDSTEESEDAPPKETTAKRDRPEKVPPPTRARIKRMCKYFVGKGQCRMGKSCRFKHELLERGNRRGNDRRVEGPPERRRVGLSLYQRLVEQEKRNDEEKAKREAEVQGGESSILEQYGDKRSWFGSEYLDVKDLVSRC